MFGIVGFLNGMFFVPSFLKIGHMVKRWGHADGGVTSEAKILVFSEGK
jgi:hypothetical protein